MTIQSTHSELHALSTGCPQFTTDHNLATLCTTLHNKTQHAVACSPHSQTIEKLITEGLALSDSGQTTALDLGSVERNGLLGELEALLDESCELTNSSALFSQNLLCVRCADNDIGDSGCDANFDTRVALLSQLTLEEFVQLGEKDTI
jgi:hypothetical protein